MGEGARWRLGWWVSLAVVLLQGCPPQGSPSNSFLDRYLGALCEREVRCGRWASDRIPDCRAWAASTQPGLVAAVTGGTTVPLPAAEGCISALANQPCLQVTTDECRVPLFEGRLDAGAPCRVDDECAAGNVCGGGAWCGHVCGPKGGEGQNCRAFTQGGCLEGLFCEADVCRPRLGLGASCTGLEQGCQRDAFCLRGVCVPQAAPGAPCLDLPDGGLAANCVDSARCVGAVCIPKADAGAHCYFEDECLGQVCDQNRCLEGRLGAPCDRTVPCAAGLRCDVAGGTCQPQAYRRVGESCGAGDFCLEQACRGLVPAPDGGVGTLGTCRSPRIGDPCGVNDHCGLFSLRCVSGVCAALVAGAACNDASDCVPQEYCVGGSCVPRPGPGASCAPWPTVLCAPGTVCALAEDGPPGSAGALRCVPWGQTGSSCRPRADGAFSACPMPLLCIQGQCALGGSPGQPCLNGQYCLAGLCRGGVDGGSLCTTGLDAGAFCRVGSECASMSCSPRDNTCQPACP